MLKELTNGNYFLYQINDGGCGIVKAENKAQAALVVVNSYNKVTHSSYNVDDVKIHPLSFGHYLDEAPNVIELGWEINSNCWD